MVPTRDPAAAAAAPVPLQGEIEARAAEPAEAVGLARGRRDLPAGHGGGRQRTGPVAQQQAKPAKQEQQQQAKNEKSQQQKQREQQQQQKQQEQQQQDSQAVTVTGCPGRT